MTVAERKVQKVLERLDSDFEFYARNCLKIVTRAGEVVPLELVPGQRKIDEAILAQEEAGKPIRIALLKARQTGGSTYVQGKLIHRATRRQNRRARVVAHDEETAQALFEIGQTMYSRLPEEVKPPLAYGQRGRRMQFGERSRYSNATGPGYGSSLQVDTAADVTGGRGLTIHYLHLSEAAFYKDLGVKLLSLLSAVPDVPDSMVVVESTASGFNEFKDFWDQAERGENGFAPVFISWLEEPSYSLPFASPEEQERFGEQVGQGEIGEAERYLLEEGATLEQLHWRRQTITSKFGGNLERFKQEMPSNPVEAFLAAGLRVFEPRFVQRILGRCREAKPIPGVLSSKDDKPFKGAGRIYTIPGTPVWEKRSGAPWKVFRFPTDREQRFVVAVDVSGGEGISDGGRHDPAWHAIQVIDHRSREQVAAYHSRSDLDVLARQAYLAAKLWNDAWLAVEITGGWGLPVARIIRRDFHYPFMYQRKKLDRASVDSSQDRLGWDTNRITKPLIVEHMIRLVRDDQDGIVDEQTAREMLTFVRDDRGRTGPERGKHDDLLIAEMIAQFVAEELPPRRDRKSSSTGPQSYHTASNLITGY